MKNKLQLFQKELLQKIEEILYTDWNPLGGDDVPRDEYDSYALQVFGIFMNGNFTYEKGFLPVYTDEYKNLLEEKVKKAIELLYHAEISNMGLSGDEQNCIIVVENIKTMYKNYAFTLDLNRMSLYLDELIKNQNEQIKNNNHDFSWLKGRCDPSLLATQSFVEDLLKINWQKYNIDQKESFVEEIADPISKGGFLRVCIKHTDKTIKTYTYGKEKEEVFVEIILAEEATITYPGGHSHGDYYDYSTGEYILDNETIRLINEILENELRIRYIFRGKHLIGSGIWEEKNQRYWMCHGAMDFLNPMHWIRKWLGLLEDEKEEIITINWKK